jgi:hypothetical protein
MYMSETTRSKLLGNLEKINNIKQRINISGDSNTKLTLSGWSKQEGANPNGGYTRWCAKMGGLVAPSYSMRLFLPRRKKKLVFPVCIGKRPVFLWETLILLLIKGTEKSIEKVFGDVPLG